MKGKIVVKVTSGVYGEIEATRGVSQTPDTVFAFPSGHPESPSTVFAKDGGR